MSSDPARPGHGRPVPAAHAWRAEPLDAGRADPAPHRGQRRVELGGDPPVPGPAGAGRAALDPMTAVVSARHGVAAAGSNTWVSRQVRQRALRGRYPTYVTVVAHVRVRACPRGAAGGRIPGTRVRRRRGRSRPCRVGDSEPPASRATLVSRQAAGAGSRHRPDRRRAPAHPDRALIRSRGRAEGCARPTGRTHPKSRGRVTMFVGFASLVGPAGATRFTTGDTDAAFARRVAAAQILVHGP